MRHFNACKLSVAALLVGASCATSSLAFADDHAATPTARTPEPASEQRGFVWDFGTAAVVPTGKFADIAGPDMSDIAPGVGMSLSFGAYFHRHLGFTAGGRASSHSLGGNSCTKPANASDGCRAFSVQVPVMLQYAFDTRKQGLYAEAGLGLFTHYFLVGGTGSVDFSNHFGEVKGGLGYRVPASVFTDSKKPSRGSLDFFANVDVGQFNTVSAHAGGESASADITRAAWHYTFEVGVRIHRTE